MRIFVAIAMFIVMGGMCKYAYEGNFAMLLVGLALMQMLSAYYIVGGDKE